VRLFAALTATGPWWMVADVPPAVDRLFELSPDLIVVAGYDGRFRRVNPAFESSLGYAEADLVGRSVLDTAHPDDRELSGRALESLMRGEEVAELEARLLASDGSTRWVQWNARSVTDEGVIYALGRDVTDRRRAEDDLRLLANEQSALRRVATLVARGVGPAEVFHTVSIEAGRLLGTENTALMRFDADGTGVVMHDLPRPAPICAGTRVSLEGDNVSGEVFRTGRTAQMDDYRAAAGPIAGLARARSVRSSLGAPIVVGGRLWGVVVSSWSEMQSPPPDAEPRLRQFTELAASAVANADHRAELVASRARVVAAADAARRKIERDLHDGAQQRLVQTVVTLKLACQALRKGDCEAESALADALAHAVEANAELRELAHGILPGALTRGGLAAGVKVLVARLKIPVTVDVSVGRLPAATEASAYFVVAEALTNVTKHSGATSVSVKSRVEDGSLRVEVGDDGVGGADACGTGLLGLADRVAAFEGQFEVVSPRGGGTVLTATFPLPDP
jgi:PAS domain S-box-containing protein